MPLANQLIASNPNLVVLLGGDGDTATALVPIFNQASIPIFATTGQASFDKATQPFFWRDVPPDEAQGYGMALAAQKLGYSRVALVFGNDVAAQGTAPTARKGARALGLNVVVDQTIALNQPSYRTEVEQLIAAHPQAIISEADPQTTGTYMSELKQLGGTPPPIVGISSHSIRRGGRQWYMPSAHRRSTSSSSRLSHTRHRIRPGPKRG